jgi:hypothetical protein
MAHVVTYVEIDVDHCSLTYSVPPCQASLGGDSNMVLLLHLDGADGSTTITDSSALLHVFTPQGNAQIDTGQSVFGGASLLLDGTGDYLQGDGSTDFAFGTGDFTVDFWVRFNSTSGVQTLYDGRDTSPSIAPALYVNGGAIRYFTDSSDRITGATVLSTGVWYHVELTRSGTSTRLFLNGVQEGTTYSDSNNYVTAANRPLIGGNETAGLTVNGWIDELRVLKGSAAHTANFTPPTEAYSLGTATGTRKCFNSLGTCQDPENFTDEPVTYRFSEDTGFDHPGVHALPLIKEIDIKPSILSLGGNLGQRSVITVRFRDARHSDASPDYDKYADERDYDPFTQGTYWGKFRARNPFLRGRPLRLLWGTLEDTLESMETRLFVIDKFSGPDLDGTFEIVANDPLIDAVGERAQAPLLSEGVLAGVVQSDSPISTSLELEPAGAGAAYGLDGYANIGGKEIVLFMASHEFLSGFWDFETGLDSLARPVSGGEVQNGLDFVAVGNAAVTSATSAFGTQSLALDGTGDYIANNDLTGPFTPAAADWNLEIYARLTSLGAVRYLWDQRPSATNGLYITLRVNASNVLEFFTNSAVQITGSTALQVNTWHRIRLSKLSSQTRLFLDNVQEGSTYADTNSYLSGGANRPVIGANGNSLGANAWIGQLDNIIYEDGQGFATDPSSVAVRTTIQDFDIGDDWAITRGQLGTEAQNHEAGDRVQLVLQYSSQDPADIIHDLLVNYTTIDEAFIPLATWQTETETFLGSEYSAVIAEPTDVDELIGELLDQAALALWWDEVTHLIRLQVLRPVPTTADRFSEQNTLAETMEVRDQPDKRISQVWTYFGLIDPTKPLDQTDNYRTSEVTTDLAAEADYGSPMIVKIFSRWIPSTGTAVAQTLNNLKLQMYRDPPRRFNFELLRNNAVNVQLGGGYQLAHWSFQDDVGALVDVPVQVTSVEARTDRLLVEAEELLLEEEDFGSPPTRYLIIATDTNDFNFREAYDALYADPVSGDVAVCRIETGVTVGSTDDDEPAFTVGTWPAGVTLVLEIQADARIQGRGGRGGSGASGPISGTIGATGGTALFTEQAMTVRLLDASSAIWGGGGGGGGGRRGSSSTEQGGGGGGGAGTLGGIGGTGPGNAENGDPGTSTAGGEGGLGASDAGITRGGTGGTGGGPGLVGSAGTGGTTGTNGAGGAAGNAVDGDSFITYEGSGDIRGGQVN